MEQSLTKEVEGNKIIAIFMGEKIAQVNIRGNVSYHLAGGFLEELSYHSSWDWQVPAWGKVSLAVKELIPKLSNVEHEARWYFDLVTKYEKAIFQNKPEDGQKIIVELLKWYNNQVNIDKK